MDFNVIRPKPPPAKKPDPPPPKPAAPPAPTAPPAPPPKPPGPPPFPPPPFGVVAPPGAYTEDHLDPVYRMYNPRSVDFNNARTWTLNYENYSDNYGDVYYSHHPVRIKGPITSGGGNPQTMTMMAPPQQQRYLQALPPPGHEYQQLGLPAPNHHYEPQRPTLPPPGYNHGPQHPGNYYPGYFSDENPNGCMIM